MSDKDRSCCRGGTKVEFNLSDAEMTKALDRCRRVLNGHGGLSGGCRG